jgi:uncharacterized membrane protein YtjA (UPF0391 family)
LTNQQSEAAGQKQDDKNDDDEADNTPKPAPAVATVTEKSSSKQNDQKDDDYQGRIGHGHLSAAIAAAIVGKDLQCPLGCLLVQPLVNLLAHLVFRNAVTLLDLALELFTVAADFGQIIVRNSSPFRFDFAGELLPISFDAIPIHNALLFSLSLFDGKRGAQSLVPMDLAAGTASYSSPGPGTFSCARRWREKRPRRKAMLSWAITFLIIALIAAVLGFGGIALISIELAKIIFFVAIVLFALSAVLSLLRRSEPRAF